MARHLGFGTSTTISQAVASTINYHCNLLIDLAPQLGATGRISSVSAVLSGRFTPNCGSWVKLSEQLHREKESMETFVRTSLKSLFPAPLKRV